MLTVVLPRVSLVIHEPLRRTSVSRPTLKRRGSDTAPLPVLAASLARQNLAADDIHPSLSAKSLLGSSRPLCPRAPPPQVKSHNTRTRSHGQQRRRAGQVRADPRHRQLSAARQPSPACVRFRFGFRLQRPAPACAFGAPKPCGAELTLALRLGASASSVWGPRG